MALRPYLYGQRFPRMGEGSPASETGLTPERAALAGALGYATSGGGAHPMLVDPELLRGRLAPFLE